MKDRSRSSGWFGAPPRGLLLLLFRVPIYLYRFNLGWLFGHRCLLLIHRGRRSGLVRETALEVIRYDPVTRESVVLSGWGKKADWYRNISASPALEVRIGRERYVPEQTFLDPEKTHSTIYEFASRHPWEIRLFARLLGYPLYGSEAEQRAFAEAVQLVALRPFRP